MRNCIGLRSHLIRFVSLSRRFSSPGLSVLTAEITYRNNTDSKRYQEQEEHSKQWVNAEPEDLLLMVSVKLYQVSGALAFIRDSEVDT